MWYNLDTDKLAVLLLPTHWRKAINVAWVRSLLAPVKSLHYEFKTNRDRNIYQVRHNWMKRSLQKSLNDEFDPSERRITIDEPNQYANRYIYTHIEHKPKWLPMYLRTSQELGGGGADFTVNMNGATANRDDVEAWIEFYKLDGPKYTIINFGNQVLQEFEVISYE